MTVTLTKTHTEQPATVDTPKGTRVRMADGNTGTLRWLNHAGESQRLHGIELDEIGEYGITGTWAEVGTVTVMTDQTAPTETARDKQNRRIAELRAANQEEPVTTEQPAPRPVATVNVPGGFAEWLEGTSAVQGQSDDDPESLALRLAYTHGKWVRRGRSTTLVMEGDLTVMTVLAEYAYGFLKMFGEDDGEGSRAETDGASKTLERAKAAQASLKAAAQPMAS
ncbi:hypothetical protein ACFQ0M_48295 [Kitasatospora aburaviensis]|uniref:Uncharacterized protein n=1 Tax=Kitasatospora aburaviensis TaxID=67265 RepID=A0ABW1EXT2_9ACTN